MGPSVISSWTKAHSRPTVLVRSTGKLGTRCPRHFSGRANVRRAEQPHGPEQLLRQKTRIGSWMANGPRAIGWVPQTVPHGNSTAKAKSVKMNSLPRIGRLNGMHHPSRVHSCFLNPWSNFATKQCAWNAMWKQNTGYLTQIRAIRAHPSSLKTSVFRADRT